MPLHLADVSMQSNFLRAVSCRAAAISSKCGALIPHLIQSSKSYSNKRAKYRSTSTGEALGLSLIARSNGIRGQVFILEGIVSITLIFRIAACCLYVAPSPEYFLLILPVNLVVSNFSFYSAIFFSSSSFFYKSLAYF